jgi:hypothetical protein
LKRTTFLSALGAFALGLGLTASARAIDDATFFQGIRLGQTFKEIDAFFKPYSYELGMMWHSGALPGERDYDLRTASVPQRRIYFSVRASDNRVVSVMYWKLGDYQHPERQETFSEAEIARLTAANSLPSGAKVHRKLNVEDGDAELSFCSEAEYVKQLRNAN